MSGADIGILVALAATITTLVGLITALYAKLKLALGKILVIDEDGKVRGIKFLEIIRIVISAVATAEETGKKGAEKKEIAMATVQSTLDEMGADYDITELSSTIDTLVTLINAFIKKTKKK